MARDTWRNAEGFGRPEEIGPDVWSAVGPDSEDHSIHCSFIYRQGILPCDCDATRSRFATTAEGKGIWYQRWVRWQTARSSRFRTGKLIKWPVTGPDGDAWIPGIDFHDDKDTE